jgi:hypothetical protein
MSGGPLLPSQGSLVTGTPPLALARIMHEAPSRDRGDGGATGQPSRGTAGLGPGAYLSARREVRDPRTPGSRLRKTGGRRRQGDLRNKAYRSHYVLLKVRQASRPLSATPLQGRASRVYYQ